MASFRSEMQVPINKSEKISSLNLNLDDKKVYNSNDWSVDQWSDKIKFSIPKEHANNIQDYLAKPRLYTNESSSSKFDMNDESFDTLNSIRIFKQLYTTIGQGDDGSIHFKATFDVKQVDPDSVKVFVKDGFVILTTEITEQIAESSHNIKKSGKNTVVKEYSRKFNLPPNIDATTISCSVSTDRILTLDAIVQTIDRRSQTNVINNDNNRNNNEKTSNLSSYNLTNVSPSWNLSSSASVFDPMSPSTNSRYTLNIPIGTQYSPDHISIKTRDQKLYLGARAEQKINNRTNYREFSKEITLPNNVDPLTLSATLSGDGILHIDAPYTLSSPQSPIL